MRNLNTPLRAAQTILTVPVLALNCYLTNWYVKHTKLNMSPRATVLPVFVGGVTILSLLYLFFNAPLQITHGNRTSNPRFFNKWLVLLLDSSLCVLWFVAWIYECVFRARLTLCYGEICELMALAGGFGAVVSFLFLATTVLAALHVVRTRGEVEAPVQDDRTHSTWLGDGQKRSQRSSFASQRLSIVSHRSSVAGHRISVAIPSSAIAIAL